MIQEKLSAGTLPNIKQVMETYISRIEVYPDKAVIIFNFFPKISIRIANIQDAESPSPDRQGTDCQPNLADDLSGEVQKYYNTLSREHDKRLITKPFKH